MRSAAAAPSGQRLRFKTYVKARRFNAQAETSQKPRPVTCAMMSSVAMRGIVTENVRMLP
jgi:hypothetical protein